MRLYRRRHPEFHRLRRAPRSRRSGPSRSFSSSRPRRRGRSTTSWTRSPTSRASTSTQGLIARLYDPIAAMPSIHIAYAVVTAAGHRRDEPLAIRPRVGACLSAGGGVRDLRDREPLRPRRGRGRGARPRRPQARPRARVDEAREGAGSERLQSPGGAEVTRYDDLGAVALDRADDRLRDLLGLEDEAASQTMREEVALWEARVSRRARG